MIRTTRARVLSGEVAVLNDGIPTRYRRSRNSKRAREEGGSEEEEGKRVTPTTTTTTMTTTTTDDAPTTTTTTTTTSTTTTTTTREDVSSLLGDEYDYVDHSEWQEWQENAVVQTPPIIEEEEAVEVETWDLTINLAASPAEILREAQVDWLQSTRCNCRDCIRETGGKGRNVIEYERDRKQRRTNHRDLWMWCASVPSELVRDFPSIDEIACM